MAVDLANEWKLREELHEAVVADLLGPAGVPEEEIVGTSVRDRYLLGKLAPLSVPPDPVAIEDRNRGGQVSAEDGAAEEEEPLHHSLMPSSFGMTFCVDASVELLSCEVRWGAYEWIVSASVIDRDGNPAKAWKRHPSGGSVDLSMLPGEHEIVPDPINPAVHLRLIVREASNSGERLVSVFLVNGQAEPKKKVDSAWLFQPEVIVRAPDGSAVFRKKHAREDVLADHERAALSMLYRDHVEFAVGHGVSVHATTAPGKVDKAVEIRTAVVPFYEVPRTEIPTPDDIPVFSDLVLDMKRLAEMDRTDLVSNLRILVDAYGTWIDAQWERLESGEMTGFERSAERALLRCSRMKDRLGAGIQKLSEDGLSLAAFRFANRAMWLQRVRGKYAQERRRGRKIDLSDVDKPENYSWYPFQLAFVLLGIPPLADPLHDDRTSIGSAIADLLWFPTGGGKTEAYLGLAAFTMAIRRLQGAVGDLDGMRGVAVIMRYTLRLLTIQQFQRASTLICAMEYLRGKALESGDESLGTTPFRLGLWVGQRATPNRTSDAEVAVQNAHGDSYQNRGTGTPQQLRNCPWCGSKIEMGKGHIKVKPLSGDIGRTLTFCSDKYGRCLFSERQSPNEGIPVVVVDEEIYRLLPAMIVGTVDKFAQMPWKGEVQALFGRVSGECPRHGFISPDTEADCNGRHRKSGNLPATVRIDCKRLRPPDLVIQDEFHLISGPLGTMVGLYETAVDELCSWELDGKRIHPKVLASTATARRAREQMHAVFLRQVEIFPPHGIDAVDNFFSRQRRVSAEKPGRRYMGICAPGHSRPAVLIRVYTAFLTAAEALRQTYGAIADPWMTCVGYFNSLRELGGMRRLVEDDVKTRAYRIERGELSRPGLAQRDIRVIEELTSRASSTDIPKILDRLEHRFRGTDEDKAQPAIDVVLATNMISVGVDVQRLGLMIVNGQPKTTAEYIQASSRVGRHHPGLVCTVLNWSRPRGLSHYETFEHYHSTFYQHVEAQSVSPFSPRAVDRGLTGVLASLIRLDDSEYNPNEGAGRLEISGAPAAVRAVDSVSQRAWEVTESDDAKKHVRHALEHRIDRWVNESEVPGRQLGYKPKRDGSTVGLLKVPGVRSWGVFTVPTSMREVEPPASLILEEEVRFDSPSWRSNSDSGDK